jgi:hypothetical protein
MPPHSCLARAPSARSRAVFSHAAPLSYRLTLMPPHSMRRCRVAAGGAAGGAQRALGWRDLNESATATWTEVDEAEKQRAAAEGRYASPALVSTLIAWWTLSRCTVAIVAPVKSTFSATAAVVARVPKVPCCSHLDGSRRAGERAHRLSAESRVARLRREKLDARYLRERAAQRGFCAVTDDNQPGDCQEGGQGPAQGSLPLPANMSTSWRLAGGWCEEQCRHCSRCRYVSLSRKFRDCSWFARCDLSRLLTSVPEFRTLKLQVQRQQ